MAHYTIRKRFRADQPVFCASVIQKNKGIITFSKSKTAAAKWAKNLVSQLEINEAMNHPGPKEMTLGDLINEYMIRKEKSNRPLGRTASYGYKTIIKHPIAELVSSKIQSHDIVQFCLQRKNSEHNPSPATISIDVSLIRKVLRIGKSLLGVHCNQQSVIEAYWTL